MLETLREHIDKNMKNTKIVRFHYSGKQICIVFDIFGLVNQPFLAKIVHIVFFFLIVFPMSGRIINELSRRILEYKGRVLYNGWVVKFLERKCYSDFVYTKVYTFEIDVIYFCCYICNTFFLYYIGCGDGDFRRSYGQEYDEYSNSLISLLW